MSNEELKAKLERWFYPCPEYFTPVQAAAEVIALQKKIEAEAWGDDELVRLDTCLRLNSLQTDLYLVDRIINKTIDFKFNKKASHLRQMFEKKNLQSTREHFEYFNSISTPGKRDFIRRAQNLSKNIEENSFRTMNTACSGVFLNVKTKKAELIGEHAIRQITEIKNNLHDVGHWSYEFQTHPLLDGPKTTQEMIACTRAYVDYHSTFYLNLTFDQLLKIDNDTLVDQTILSMLCHLEDLRDDLPDKVIKQQISQEKEFISDVLENCSPGYDKLSNLLHYFIEHNEEKLPAQSYALLSNCLSVMQFGVLEMFVESGGYKFKQFVENNELALEHVKSVMISNTYLDISKPKPEETYENVKAAILEKYEGKPKKAQNEIERLNEVRVKKPAGMEERTILHYRESEKFRKIRASVFKSKWVGDGDDGPKRAFIKKLANEHLSDLLKVGFDKHDISEMRKTGKLPEKCGWNVEHIVDREHGGTNHEHNFILMPEWINSLKDDYKRAQIFNISDSEKGCWINTFMPKRNDDGTYPSIYMENYREACEYVPQGSLVSLVYEV